MTQINIIGTIFGTSGYDSHTRGLANALNKLIDVRLSVPRPTDWEKQINDSELKMLKRESKEEINLIIALPHQWKLCTNNYRNWAYLIWEGDKIPESWIEDLLNPDIEKIFIPSNHVKKAILNTTKDKIIQKKLKIVPHGVDLTKFYSMEKPKRYDVFLANKGFRNLEDRGGIQYLIKAFIEEFKKDEAELIIKINPAYGIPDLNKIMQELGYTENSPKITFIGNAVPQEDLVKFYNQGNIFVSSTRAEAFNIPCLEAMACGLPIITTNFGGQTDYCNKKNSWIISGELTEVKHEIEYEGIKWLTPDIKQLRKAMRDAIDNPFTIINKSQESLKTAQKYTWDNSAKEILKCLGQTQKA